MAARGGHFVIKAEPPRNGHARAPQRQPNVKRMFNGIAISEGCWHPHTSTNAKPSTRRENP
jgi:hypothetical protein